MIKPKEQQLSFIEEKSNNNFKSFMDKKLLEVNNITNNQKFVIDNAYDFYNQVERIGKFSQKSNIKNITLRVLSTLIIGYCFFISAIFFVGFEKKLVGPFFISGLICTVICLFSLIFDANFLLYLKKKRIDIFKIFFDNQYESVSPAQIYYTQNKEVSENDLNKPNFWNPMNIEELFNWIEENKT